MTNLSGIILESLDNAWNPLIERLADLDDDEYWWEPVTGCWTIRAGDDGTTMADWADPDPVPALFTTIAWRCWHIAVDALDSYSSRLFRRTGTGLHGRHWVSTADEARTMLAASWSVFRSGVAAWSDDPSGDGSLWTPLGAAWGRYAEKNNLELALHAQREVIHHGAEIALLRDLHAAR